MMPSLWCDYNTKLHLKHHFNIFNRIISPSTKYYTFKYILMTHVFCSRHLLCNTKCKGFSEIIGQALPPFRTALNTLRKCLLLWLMSSLLGLMMAHNLPSGVSRLNLAFICPWKIGRLNNTTYYLSTYVMALLGY